MKFANMTLLAIVALGLASCGLMSAEQQSTALQVIDQMRMQGTITEAQYAALKETVLSSGQVAWWQQAAQVVLGAGLGYLGVSMKPPARVDNKKIPS